MLTKSKQHFKQFKSSTTLQMKHLSNLIRIPNKVNRSTVKKGEIKLKV